MQNDFSMSYLHYIQMLKKQLILTEVMGGTVASWRLYSPLNRVVLV